MKKTRVLLIQPNRILHDGLEAIINKQADLKVAAASRGNHDILLQVRTLKPQVVLIDLASEKENGLRLVTALTRELPGVKAVGMGLFPSRKDIIEFIQAGAAGFILKDASKRDVLGTIRAVAKGMKILPPVMTNMLLEHVVAVAARKANVTLPEAMRATKREREIVALIAEGLSNRQIAQRLSISLNTVKSHVHSVLEKLALQSRLQISAYVHREDPLE